MNEAILDKIYNAGVVGAGGAGFPTHKKLAKGAKWLIVNAAECEPLLQSDIYICEHFADELIDTLVQLKQAFEFENVVIGIKKKHHEAVELLSDAINRNNAPVAIHLLDSVYPTGDEQVLVFEVTGETVPPGGIPIQIGAVVVNNTTVYNIGQALKDKPVTQRLVTVTGEVVRPILLNVPVGTSVAECIRMAGGSRLDRYMFIMGGPMMGKQYTYAQTEDVHITKTDGGIIVLPIDHYLRTFLEKPLENVALQARTTCIQCRFCTDMCPRYLIGHHMRPHLVMRSLGTNVSVEDMTDAMLCCECGICELYACPMQLSPRQVNIMMKKKLREKGLKGDSNVYKEQIEAREYRQIPQKRLVYRLGLEDYDKHIERYEVCNPQRVSIPLRQGIGRPSECTVKVGDKVKSGDLIGKVSIDDMGANVHASLDGVVEYVGTEVVICSEKFHMKGGDGI